MKPAFSTVACPDWTLDQVVDAARRFGYLGVELRTEGFGSTHNACDPGLSSATKVRAMFAAAGVEIICLSSSLRFDDPVSPPVVGNTFIFDQESAVRRGKALVDMAVALEVPYVRVFGYETVNNESTNATIARIANRLGKVVDYARNSGVTVLLENGGSFETAGAMKSVLDAINNPLLCASYSVPVARAAGERLSHGVLTLGDKLRVAKFKDLSHGVPCALGDGDLCASCSFKEVRSSGFKGWAVYEYDRAYFPELGDPSAALEASAKTMFGWLNSCCKSCQPAASH